MTLAGRPRAADIGLLLLLNVVWGTTYVVARGAMDETPPLVLAFLRFAVAAAAFALLRAAGKLRCRGIPHQPTAEGSVPMDAEASRAIAWWVIPVVGIVGFGLAKWLNYEGLIRSTATDAALIINLEAVFTALLAIAWLRQRVVPAQWLGILVAGAGGAALVWPAGFTAEAVARGWGNLLLTASVAAEAVASVLGVRAMCRYSGLEVTERGVYWGAALLLLPAWAQWAAGGYTMNWLTWGNAAAILYLGLGATILAYWVWYYVLGRVDAAYAGAFLYVQPVVGIALGILLRREWPTTLGWLGGALVIGGILIAGAAARRRPAPQDVS